MTQRPDGRSEPRARSPGAPSSPADSWEDWVTIWESEMSALATDREAQLLWARLVTFWAAQARLAGTFLADGQAGRAAAEPPAGAAPAAAAPDAGDAERQRDALERLARRVEELERRLADLSGGRPG